MQSPAPAPPSALGEFLRRLEDSGEAIVPPFGDAPIANDTESAALLQAWDAAAREELSGPVPSLDVAAALWAARMFYRACQALACRDVPPDTIAAALAEPCPSPRGPAVDFSVDLVFRHLPELHAYARRSAPADPLVTVLESWARAWPLSSPGIALAEAPSLETFAACAPLCRLYVDRVAARGASDRWRDSRVAAQLRADLGAFPELHPALAAALARANSPSTSPPDSINPS